jgi:4-amino-4-deoxy-L-arabinose transferase-like glycosyltransferase
MHPAESLRTAPRASFELWRQRRLLVVLLLILFLRGLSLGWLALTDPTEGRYTDIALNMFEAKQWITPEIIIQNQQVPYWGKPPLHFWLTAISFRIFGVSEWSARFPSFLSGLWIVAMTFVLAARLRGVRNALIACIILSSSGLFFVLSGASVIDVTLSATVTAAMVCFALASMEGQSRRFGIGFFISLAAGMLAKGPVALLLVFLAIGIWLLLTRQWQAVRKLPWRIGGLLFLLISVPWYVFAELRTPGFLRYFFINEHILRYLVHDYGDKYGSGHLYPRGTSWVMLLLTFLPWSAALVLLVWSNGKKLFSDRRNAYLMAWGLAPAIFFTLSRQILATYLLPGFAALAVAIASEVTQTHVKKSLRLVLNYQALFVLLLLLIAVIAGSLRHLPLLMISAAALVMAISFVLCRIFFNRSVSAAVSLTALGCALFITISTFDFREAIDEQDSAKTMMTAMVKDRRYSNSNVIFPFGVPYSAIFYEEALLHRHALLDGKAPEADGDILVFTRLQWNHLILPIKRQLLPVYETPHWVACRAIRSQTTL